MAKKISNKGHNRLTEKQDLFSIDIANKKYKFHWEAYAAHYDCSKMSQNAIYVETCRLLQNPKVALRIEELEAKIKNKEIVTLNDVIQKLSDRVNMDIRDMFNDDSTFKEIKQMTQLQATFLNSFEVHELWGWESKEVGGKTVKVKTQMGLVKKIKMESIKDILDMLMKYHGGYAKDNDSGTADALTHLADIIGEAKKNDTK